MEITLEEQYQHRIEHLEKQVEELRTKYISLVQKTDSAFHGSPEYEKMKEQLERYKYMAELKETSMERRLKAYARDMERVKTITEDNENLCQDHLLKYWEGITKYHSWDANKLARLERDNAELKATIEARDTTIQYLKDVLNGVDPTKPKEVVMGRKPIDSATKKRILSLRLKGYTLKEISSMEGVSLGAVSNLCRGMKRPKKGDTQLNFK